MKHNKKELKDTPLSVVFSFFLLASLFVFMGEDQPSGGLGVSGCEGCETSGGGNKCTGDSSCTPFACDLSTGKCRTKCTGNVHCAGGYFCDDNGTCKTEGILKTTKSFACKYCTNTGFDIGGSLCCEEVFPSGDCFEVTIYYKSGNVATTDSPQGCESKCSLHSCGVITTKPSP